MKTAFVAIGLMLGSMLLRQDVSEEFQCLISSSKKTYSLGELPEIKVSIINKSNRDVYLVGGLDGSERKIRKPYCYFTIKRPGDHPALSMEGCGTVNPLRAEDFVLVKSGGIFDPYQSVDDYGFFTSFQMSRKANFNEAGIYIITFHYSTLAESLNDYAAYESNFKELQAKFERVPKIQLRSNTLTIEIIE